MFEDKKCNEISIFEKATLIRERKFRRCKATRLYQKQLSSQAIGALCFFLARERDRSAREREINLN